VYAGSVYWPFHLDKSTGLKIAIPLALVVAAIDIGKTLRSR
jgi:hypothetical protein